MSHLTIRAVTGSDAGQVRRRPAFTLIELLVVMAVIALLLGVLLPALAAFRRSGRLARDLSSARQLMVAYRAYAYDSNGALIPGYYLGGDLPPVQDQAGRELNVGTGVEQGGYVWRLAPYLDYNLPALYDDPRVLEEAEAATLSTYQVALFPAFGINSTFLGGDWDYGGWYDGFIQAYGKPQAERLSQVKHSADVFVFATARINGPIAEELGMGAGTVEGYFRVLPPYFTARLWADHYEPECQYPGCNTSEFGHVSLRHQGPAAAVAFFDGHAGTLDEVEMQDMRHWADKADRPDWTMSPLP